MNNNRRQRIKEVCEQLSATRDTLEEISNEEREAYDNMPEGLQEGERGQAVDDAARGLENAFNDLDSMITDLEELTEG